MYVACVTNIHRPKLLLVVEPSQGLAQGSTVAVLAVKTDLPDWVSHTLGIFISWLPHRQANHPHSSMSPRHSC